MVFMVFLWFSYVFLWFSRWINGSLVVKTRLPGSSSNAATALRPEEFCTCGGFFLAADEGIYYVEMG